MARGEFRRPCNCPPYVRVAVRYGVTFDAIRTVHHPFHPELPNPLAAVVDRATATRIEDRYPNARAMSADLETAARTSAAATAALVVELFGTDLTDEAHRMATFTPLHATLSVIRLSSG